MSTGWRSFSPPELTYACRRASGGQKVSKPGRPQGAQGRPDQLSDAVGPALVPAASVVTQMSHCPSPSAGRTGDAVVVLVKPGPVGGIVRGNVPTAILM